MTNTIRIIFTFLAILLFAPGCATDTDDLQTDEAIDESAALDPEAALDIPSELDPLSDAASLLGCSNQQIREAQARCRTLCGSRGSNGIHWCDTDLIVIRFQCDCRTGADPTDSLLD